MQDVPSQPQAAPRTLVIYAGDASYAYPMLVSARSLRANASIDVDVWIFAADYAPDLLARAAAVADSFGARVVPLSSRDYLRFDPARFRTEPAFSHLKPAVLSRLVTGPHIPETYDQVLYLDGDTHWVGDIAPLLRFRAPKGRLMGCPDSINFYKYDSGRYAAGKRALMGDWGLSPDDIWYNTGVMMAERQTWAERGAAALEYFVEHIETCPFPVDGSTNATAKGLWLPISCRWNFMAPMRMWGLDAAVAPALYHFTGREKPWLGRVAPWQDFWPRYAAIRAEQAMGALAGPLASAAEIDAVNRRRAFGRFKDATVLSARAARSRAALLESERAAVV